MSVRLALRARWHGCVSTACRERGRDGRAGRGVQAGVARAPSWARSQPPAPPERPAEARGVRAKVRRVQGLTEGSGTRAPVAVGCRWVAERCAGCGSGQARPGPACAAPVLRQLDGLELLIEHCFGLEARGLAAHQTTDAHDVAGGASGGAAGGPERRRNRASGFEGLGQARRHGDWLACRIGHEWAGQAPHAQPYLGRLQGPGAPGRHAGTHTENQHGLGSTTWLGAR